MRPSQKFCLGTKKCYVMDNYRPCDDIGLQGRHGQFLASKAGTAAATFYSSKSRQGIGLGGLGGLASRDVPGLMNNIVHSFESQCEQKISR